MRVRGAFPYGAPTWPGSVPRPPVERRTGVVVRGELPAELRDVPDAGRKIGFALVDAMAEMHLLDPVACDLGDLGRPDGFVERQVAGWKKRSDLAEEGGWCEVGAALTLFLRNERGQHTGGH